jgi:hypothetical protein
MFSIFNSVLGNKEATENVDVWVQAIKINGVWQFEDGSPFSQVCPLGVSGNTKEIRLRFTTEHGECFDTQEYVTYSYVCEFL